MSDQLSHLIGQLLCYCYRYLLTSLEAGLQYLTSNQKPSAATPSEDGSKSLEDSGKISLIIRCNSIQCTNDKKSDVELFFEVCPSVNVSV